MTRFHTFFAMLFLAAGLIACGDNVAGPAEPDSSVVMVATAVITSGSEEQLIWLGFGNAPSDPLSLIDGQQMLANYPRVPVASIMAPGETSSLVVALATAWGLQQEGATPVRFEFFSDWGPLDPQEHPGVKVRWSEINLIRTGYDVETGESLPFRVEAIAVFGSNPTASITLPNNPKAVWFVYPKHKIEVTCLGEDSLTFKSRNGLLTANTDRFGTRVTHGPFFPQEVTVRCTPYSSMAAARVALRQQGIALP